MGKGLGLWQMEYTWGLSPERDPIPDVASGEGHSPSHACMLCIPRRHPSSRREVERPPNDHTCFLGCCQLPASKGSLYEFGKGLL